MMGGTIDVDSELGQGSTFTLHLPASATRGAGILPTSSVGRQDACPTSASARGRAESRLPKKAESRPPDTILVVDDDQAVRDLLERFLTGEGFRVVTAERGEDVPRMAREIRPAAITLDVMMPGQDGWAVLVALKSDPALADIPVVMLSIVDNKNLGYALGASDYLTKPVDRDRLLAVLHKYAVAGKPGVALIVEDDGATRHLLRRMLEKDGWEVCEAINGREALACLQTRPPGLILMDLMMPEMDGFELLAEMRQHPEWKTIPVVVLTSKDLTPEDRLFLNGSLLLSGCVKRVLQKGKFSRDELLNEVRSLVALARA
jgi:CheY-like chemotaxis protein